MTDIRTVGRVADNPVSEQNWITPRAWRDGTLSVADFIFTAAMEGRQFNVNAGTITAPITYGAGAIDSTEPDLVLVCPSNKIIVPTLIEVHMEAYGSTAIFEGMAAVGTGGVAGTDTDVTPTSLRTDAPYESSAAVGHSSTASATYMTTNISEFWRFGIQAVATIGTGDDDSPRDGTTFTWSAVERGQWIVMNGASQLMVYAASQAGTGFITASWIELPIGFLSGT